MEVSFECLYCGHRWYKIIYSKNIQEICAICGDRNLKVKERSAEKIDQYVGCPPFSEKLAKDIKNDYSDLESMFDRIVQNTDDSYGYF